MRFCRSEHPNAYIHSLACPAHSLTILTSSVIFPCFPTRLWSQPQTVLPILIFPNRLTLPYSISLPPKFTFINTRRLQRPQHLRPTSSTFSMRNAPSRFDYLVTPIWNKMSVSQTHPLRTNKNGPSSRCVPPYMIGTLTTTCSTCVSKFRLLNASNRIFCIFYAHELLSIVFGTDISAASHLPHFGLS